MDLSIGAVGAAVIAALISLLGLIIGKEQKTSEFRQDWINKLRDELGDYGVNVNAIADKLIVKYPTNAEKVNAMAPNYSALNKAHFSINLRLNQRETNSKNILAAMESFEALAAQDATLTSANIKPIEERFMEASRLLLKEEWDRVKAGEPIFRAAKWATAGILVLMTLLSVALIFYKAGSGTTAKPAEAAIEQERGITIYNDGSASVINSPSNVGPADVEPPSHRPGRSCQQPVVRPSTARNTKPLNTSFDRNASKLVCR